MTEDDKALLKRAAAAIDDFGNAIEIRGAAYHLAVVFYREAF